MIEHVGEMISKEGYGQMVSRGIEHIRKRLDSSEKGGSIYYYLQGIMDAYENVLSQLTEEDKRR